MELAVSTTAFRGQPIEKVIELARAENIRIEFSSGLPYRPDLAQTFLDADCQRLLHNYCPPPAVPFVLNLASFDPEILAKTLAHCRMCLELVAKSKTGFYSVHAGFCVDPDPKSLGQKLTGRMTRPREEHWQRFVQSVRELLLDCERLGVRLLIENNVLADFNVMEDGTNPLLCADGAEIERLMTEVAHPSLGILIDTGHLKVSATTLGFDADEALVRVQPYVSAFHHSDNDGAEDTNGGLPADYWFLPHAPRFTKAMHILEIHFQSVEQIRAQYRMLEAAAAGKGGHASIA